MIATTILIVDDHALFRSGLRLVLETEFPDANILEAGSIHDAINSASFNPSIILLDIALNGLNGLDGIALLQRRWPAIKIVMLSSDTSVSTSQLALELGAVAFVTKAETAKKILAVIKDVDTALCNNLNNKFKAKEEPVGDAYLRLTVRQCEVLDLLAKGLSNKVIARELGCAENTVRGHVQAILAFFNVTSRTEAAYAAKVRGIIQ
jgi:DNA-binding NarL/FixJ family response regulator